MFLRCASARLSDIEMASLRPWLIASLSVPSPHRHHKPHQPTPRTSSPRTRLRLAAPVGGAPRLRVSRRIRIRKMTPAMPSPSRNVRSNKNPSPRSSAPESPLVQKPTGNVHFISEMAERTVIVNRSRPAPIPSKGQAQAQGLRRAAQQPCSPGAQRQPQPAD